MSASKEVEMSSQTEHPIPANYYDGHSAYHKQYIRAAEGSYIRTPIQVSVHLIEARQLRPNSDTRALNPYAVMSLCGRSKRTEIQRSTTNCLWDQRFNFPSIMLSPDEMERENLYIQVYNANTFTRNHLIGQYTFSLARIHSAKRDVFDQSLHDHQLYRKWVVLTNPKKPQLEQGFLMMSCTVLKPGDVPPTHLSDYGHLYSKEGSKGFSPLSAPKVKRTSYNLKLKVYRGQHIPIMDFFRQQFGPVHRRQVQRPGSENQGGQGHVRPLLESMHHHAGLHTLPGRKH